MKPRILPVIFALTAVSPALLRAENEPKPAPAAAAEKPVRTFPAPDKKFTYIMDATVAPDLMPWAEKELIPVVIKWYPKLCGILASKGYKPTTTVKLEFRDDMKGTPAYAAGDKVSLNAPWFRTQLKGEAKGCVIHELCHVVQGYGRGRRGNRDYKPAPGWVTEGIPDYIRWFLYEPEAKGAEITRRNFENSKYDASYRTTANFLNWVVTTHDKDFIAKLNKVSRDGTYSDAVWKKSCGGKTAEELGAGWKAENAKRLGL